MSEDEWHKGIHEPVPKNLKSRSRKAHCVDQVVLQKSGTRPFTSRR